MGIVQRGGGRGGTGDSRVEGGGGGLGGGERERSSIDNLEVTEGL